MFNALKSSAMVLGVALAMGAAGVETASAQARSGAQPGGRPAPADPQRRAPTEQEVRTATGVQILQFQPAPTMTLGAVQGVNAALMQGWTPMTTGSTLGGPSIVKLPTGYRLVVRAANAGLHDAPIDVASQSVPLPASAWRQLVPTATSEPYCVPDFFSPTFYFCGYLAEGGSAAVARIGLENLGQTWAMGGSNGSGRVTLGPAPSVSVTPGQLATTLRLLVWDGSATLFRREYATVAYLAPNGQFGTPTDTVLANERGWRVVDGAFLTSVGCVREGQPDLPICAQGTTSGVRLFFDPWRSQSQGGMPTGQIVTPALPTPIGRTAPELVTTSSGAIVVVVRAANGAIYQSRRAANGASFGPWISEGGSAREGSGISCTAVNEQPICFIQGTDGRIYRKALSTASGL
jgi:hypothetical protein